MKDGNKDKTSVLLKRVQSHWIQAVLVGFGIGALGVLAFFPFVQGAAPAPMMESEGLGVPKAIVQIPPCQVRATIRRLGAESVPVLLKQVRRGELDTGEATAGLRTLGAAALPELLASLEDGDDAVRLVATLTVAAIGAHDAGQTAVVTPPLVKRLRDATGAVRCAALVGLINFRSGREEGIPGLIAALQETEGLSKTDVSTLRQGIAHLLGRIGPGAKAALPELSRISREERSPVCDAARRAMGRISGTPEIKRPSPSTCAP